MAKRPKEARPPGAISRHPRVTEIEADIAKGMTGCDIARKYSTPDHPLSKWQTIRYAQNLKRKRPTALAALRAECWRITPQRLEELRLETSNGWLAQMRAQLSRILAVQDRCIESGDDKIAVAAAAQVARLLEMLGQAVKELGPAGHTLNVSMTTNNLVLNSSYHRMRNALLDALRKHPEARADVLKALQDIEDETADGAAPLKLVNGTHHG
jgi:hypothetical protein